MNISGIDYESVANGEGVRTVIYVSGCSHNCYNCHNPQTHNINYGMLFTKDLQDEIIENIKKRQFVSGITLSGGDPLHENNIGGVLKLINKFRLLFGSTKTIWLYSGYTWEQIQIDSKRMKIVSQCDVMVDGRYIDELRDVSLQFRGSSNQRLIDVQESLKQSKVVLYKHTK